MFLIKEVNLSYGAKVLFKEISETIGPRDRIALVGSNGSGKTTLLRLLMEEETPDSGSIEKPDYATVGYLPQDGISVSGCTLKEEAGKAFTDANAIKAKLDEAEAELGEMEPDTDQFYDLIIYGSIKRCKDYYDLVSQHYPDNKVILIDGNDEPELDPLYKKHLYFKRELTIDHPNVKPITFGIPTCKLANPNRNKTQDYATCIPGQPETYIFKEERPYYEDYQKSYYGVTMKKAGWDCMRHYEILGNYCMPYFTDLEDCPKNTLSSFPKKLLLEAKELASNFDEQKYYEILDKVFKHTKEHLTTKSLAKYILGHV